MHKHVKGRKQFGRVDIVGQPLEATGQSFGCDPRVECGSQTRVFVEQVSTGEHKPHIVSGAMNLGSDVQKERMAFPGRKVGNHSGQRHIQRQGKFPAGFRPVGCRIEDVAVTGCEGACCFLMAESAVLQGPDG